MTKQETLKTEVVTVAGEEARTGEKIANMSDTDLAARASMSFIRNRKLFSNQFANLSARGKIRVVNAVLDLPADGVPVYLNSDAEKVAFAIGQRVIADRFIITQHHIVQEVKKQRAAAKAEQDKPLDSSEVVSTELEDLPKE